ncbi:hypothetical protein [Mycobacterium syngnathidarum]
MPEPEPDEMRATRDRLLAAADRFAAASADSMTKLQRAATNLPGQSATALQRMIERLSEQDRERLAGIRDLARHLPANDPQRMTPGSPTPPSKSTS